MATTLEYRRLAIVNALRAVMAEPLPAYPTSGLPVAEAPLAAMPPVETPVAEAPIAQPPAVTEAAPPNVETVLFDAPSTPTTSAASRPSLREALVAGIQWDDEDDDDAVAAVDDDAGITALQSVDDLETFDDDWESPSVPPLETSGSFSRTASMALFGHA